MILLNPLWVSDLSIFSLIFIIYIYIYIYKVWWVNCHYFKLSISRLLYLNQFYLLCSKLESVGHCLWGKQYNDAIHFSKNFKMACCDSRRKFQNKYFSVLGCQSEDRFIFMFMKTKHLVQIIVFGVATSDADDIPPDSSRYLHQVPGGSSTSLDLGGGCQ